METTLIIALLTVFSAITAPVASALITQIWTYKIKRAEMFFGTRNETYKDFLSVASKLSIPPSAEELANLQNTAAGVMLFSSEKTRDKMRTYISLQLDDPMAFQIIGIAYRDMIAAMHADLKKNK